MGRGNICTFGEYEGIWYVDRDYLDCYISKYADEHGECELKMLHDMKLSDFADFDYEEFVSEENYRDFLYEFKNQMEEKFPNFVSTGDEFGTALENNLFEIQIKDNEWSYAVCLIQKEDDYYGNSLSGLQKRHYQNYLNGMKDVLLGMFPEIGFYTSPWTHRTIRRG